MVTPMEQARRDLKGSNPDFYAYISAFEAQKILDQAGDTVSGASDGHGAANRLWALAGQAKRRASVLALKPI